MGRCKGKSIITRLLPCKQDSDSIPPPPPPPPPYTAQHPSKPSKSAPNYSHASMQFHSPPPPQGWGVTADHHPIAASGMTETRDGFNVWCIKGYNGFVKFPPNGDPVETLGRLETMNQVMHNRHGYDIEKVRGGNHTPSNPNTNTDDDDNNDDGGDDEVVGEVDDDSEDESDEEAQIVEVAPAPKISKANSKGRDREYKDITIRPPPYYTHGHSKKGTRATLDCVHCGDETTQPVKKIKAAGNTPMCWACVLGHYAAAAQYVWDGHTFGP